MGDVIVVIIVVAALIAEVALMRRITRGMTSSGTRHLPDGAHGPDPSERADAHQGSRIRRPAHDREGGPTRRGGPGDVDQGQADDSDHPINRR